ncbi:MAG: hypothetical protein JW717_01145 [Marinilabiliaceae bacterium]|nr:hypothetical protein [Marinilabiliaceae bacterium]
MKSLIIIIGLLISINTLLLSQQVKGIQSVNRGNHPEMKWVTQDSLREDSISVWRTNIKAEKFRKIETIVISNSRNDSVFYTVIDTTLTEKGIYKYYLLLHFKNDTVLMSDKMYGHNMGDIPAPAIVSVYAKSLTNRKAIELNWKLNYNFTVNALSLFRSTNYDNGYELIAHLPGNAVKYIDAVDISNEAYYYFIQIRDFFGYQFPSVRFHGICTFAEKCLAPINFEAGMENGKVKLKWEVMGNNALYSRIYRKAGAKGSFMPLHQHGVKNGEKCSFTDEKLGTFIGDDVSYYIVNISDGFINSLSTDTVTFRLHQERPIPAPKELNYIIDSLQSVRLIWTSLSNNVNVGGYNIYRTDENKKQQKLNNELIPIEVNYFVDKTTELGNSYTYEVEAVSSTGVPGIVRTKVNVSTIMPEIEMLISIKHLEKGFRLSWIPPKNITIKEIHIYRQNGENNAVLVKKVPVTQTQLVDNNLSSGEYLYYAIAKTVDGSEIIVNKGILTKID